MALFGKFYFLKGHYGENCSALKDYSVVEIMNISQRRIVIPVKIRRDSPVHPTADGAATIDPGHTLIVETDRVNFGQLKNLEQKEIIELRESKRKFPTPFI